MIRKRTRMFEQSLPGTASVGAGLCRKPRPSLER
jgi:hypothetical protein